MILLKSVIHDTKTNSVEATWVNIDDVPIKCHSYADVQMDMFRSDVAEFGGNIAEHEALIALVESGIVPPTPPTPPTPDEIGLQIKASRDARKNGGVLVSGKWFHTDTDSRIQQLGLVLMGAAVPAVPWKTMDGTYTAMSQTLAGQIFQAVALLDMALFAVAKTHQEAMEASANPAAYDFSTGWPEHFPL